MMATFGVTMVRDEIDILPFTLANMMRQCDHVIVADNRSKDGTREYLESLGDAITLVDDPEVGYRQAEKMTGLALTAFGMGARWVVPFDADEYWYSPHASRIADHVTQFRGHALLPAAMYDHVPTALDDESNPNPLTRIGWRRREPGALPKVACAADERLRIHMGNHDADYGRFTGRRVQDQLVIRHYPYRSGEQFVRKAVQGAEALKATDLPANVGAHWRQYAATVEAHGPEALIGHYLTWFYSADPAADEGLIFDPAP